MAGVNYGILTSLTVYLNSNRDELSAMTAKKAKAACVKAVGVQFPDSTFINVSRELGIQYQSKNRRGSGTPTGASRNVARAVLKIVKELDQRLTALEKLCDIQSTPLGQMSGAIQMLAAMNAGKPDYESVLSQGVNGNGSHHQIAENN